MGKIFIDYFNKDINALRKYSMNILKRIKKINLKNINILLPNNNPTCYLVFFLKNII